MHLLHYQLSTIIKCTNKLFAVLKTSGLPKDVKKEITSLNGKGVLTYRQTYYINGKIKKEREDKSYSIEDEKEISFYTKAGKLIKTQNIIHLMINTR